jgi:hypothetical protein
MNDTVLTVRLLQSLAHLEGNLSYGDVATVQPYDRSVAPNGTVEIPGYTWEQVDAGLKSLLRDGLVHSGTVRHGELPVGIMFAGLTDTGRRDLQAFPEGQPGGGYGRGGYGRGAYGVGETRSLQPTETRDVIRLIEAVIDQQNGRGEPVAVLHLTEPDRLEVRAFKERFPEVARAHGEPTADDPRPRYRQIPIARSSRDRSFAELGPQVLDGRLHAPWIPIDSPELTVGGAPSPPRSATAPAADDAVIALINAALGRLLAEGTPPSILHLVQADFEAVQSVLGRASTGPTLGVSADGGSRMYQVAVVRTNRAVSFVEFRRMDPADGQERSAFIRLDAPQEVSLEPPPTVVQPSGGSPPSPTTGADDERDAVGNVLPGSDDDSDDEEDDEFGLPSEIEAIEAELTEDDETEVIGRAPPEMPATRPAALSFTVAEGRIAVSTINAASDLNEATVLALFGMARLAAEELVDSLKATNADGRLAARLERVCGLLSAPPPSLETVFRLGHEGDVLRIYLGRAADELNADHAAAVEALAARLDECVAQYPDWRTFKRNARAADLTSEQIAAAPAIGKALVAEMETRDGQEAVDASVPSAFKDLVATYEAISMPDDPTGVIKAGCDLLAADLVDGLSNFVNVAASLAMDVYGRRYVTGFKRKWDDLAEQSGERTAVWLHRTLKVVVFGTKVSALGLGGATLWHVLATAYPTAFHPLAAAWDFIQAWAPFLEQGLR